MTITAEIALTTEVAQNFWAEAVGTAIQIALDSWTIINQSYASRPVIGTLARTPQAREHNIKHGYSPRAKHTFPFPPSASLLLFVAGRCLALRLLDPESFFPFFRTELFVVKLTKHPRSFLQPSPFSDTS